MNVNVSNLRCHFSELKYSQLLSEKYFIETCFSKKYESISSKNALLEMLAEININKEFNKSHETVVEDC